MNTTKKVLIGLGGLVVAGLGAIGAKKLVGKKDAEYEEDYENCCDVEVVTEEDVEA